MSSGGSRNFKTGGRGPGAVEFLGSGVCLMPLHTYPFFCSESKERNTYCKHCMLTIIKENPSYTYSQNYQKQTPRTFSNRGARARCAGPGSPFELSYGVIVRASKQQQN